MSEVRTVVAARWRDARSGLSTAGRTVAAVLAPVGRRAPEIVVAVGLVLTVLGAVLLVGASRDDARIDADPGTAVGEILDGSGVTRTFVRFTAADGAVLTPEDGLAYPRGLKPGNLVRVEYDRTEPLLVRVAGRSWTAGLVPVGLGVLGVWALLGPAAYGLVRRRRAAGAGISTSDEAAARAEESTPARDRAGITAERDEAGATAERDEAGATAERNEAGAPAERDEAGATAERNEAGAPAERDEAGATAERNEAGIAS